MLSRSRAFGVVGSSLLALTAILVACDSDESPPPGGTVTPDGGGSTNDANNQQPGTDAAGNTDTGAGDSGGDSGPGPFVPPTPTAVALSVAGPDALQSVVANPAGGFYAAGYAAQAVGGTRTVVVVKFTAAGAVDTTWATQGVASTSITFGGGNDEIDIGVQTSGKIIVAATIANGVDPDDTDIAVIRLNADGTADNAFAGTGTRVLDLGTAINTPRAGKDTQRSLAVGADGSIFIHGGTRNAGAVRTDLDFVVVKLTVDGALATYGTNSRFLLDMAQENATPRGIIALADGSVIAAGYANSTLVNSTVQAVAYKLDATGAIVGTPFHSVVLTTQTEIYGLANHGTYFTTGGYGNNTGTNDWVSMKFDIATMARDTTFGNAPLGAVLFDISDTAVPDNCRNAIALPGGKTLMIGSTNSANEAGQMNAAFAILDADGQLDAAYAGGRHHFPFGGAGNDQLWGAAVSGSTVLMVGFRAQTAQTANANDDAFAVAMPLR